MSFCGFVVPDEIQGPLKRPRIVPIMEVDEKSKKVRPFVVL